MSNKGTLVKHHSIIVSFLNDEDVRRKLLDFVPEKNYSESLIDEILKSAGQLQFGALGYSLGVTQRRITKIKSKLNEYLFDFSIEYSIKPKIQLYFKRQDRDVVKKDGGYLACSYTEDEIVCGRLVSLVRLESKLSKASAAIKGISEHVALKKLQETYSTPKKHPQPDILERKDPRRVIAIIIFLSPPGDDYEALIDEVIQGKSMLSENLEEQFERSPWLMPLKAIAYHWDRLKKVIVIPSTKTESDVPSFQGLVNAMAQTHRNPRDIKVFSPNELNTSFPKSVKFVSAREQNDVLNKILNHLTYQDKISREDIIIDVTGGFKMSSVAGAIVALGEGWRIQYVSTADYRIREYDITI